MSDVAKFFASEIPKEGLGGPFSRGDKVLVVRVASSGEQGWENEWVDAMDETVGRTFTVCEDHSGLYNTIGVWLGRYRYPPFVLKKV